jgi:hypothetical protein
MDLAESRHSNVKSPLTQPPRAGGHWPVIINDNFRSTRVKKLLTVLPMNIAIGSVRLASTVLILAACTYQGYEHPVARKFSWFSYLSGDDIRVGCEAGALDRLRLVYNAIYTRQVRSYDIGPSAGAGWYEVIANVTREADLSSFQTAITAPDLFKPWRPEKSVTRLRPEDLVKFKLALETDGYFEPTRVGLELPSHNFYWTGASCVAGRFHFNAFIWPAYRIEEFAFAKMLFSLDFTGVPVAPPRNVTLFDIYGTNYPDRNQNTFTVKVAENGLWRLGGPN